MTSGGIIAPNKLNLGIECLEQSKQWQYWIEELELYFSADNIQSEKRKYSLLLYLGGSELREIYETLDDNEKSYKSAKAVLNAYFLDKKNLVYECYLFNSLQQKSDENYKAFMVRLKKFGMSCEFHTYTLEDAMIDKFVTGCKDSTLRKNLLGVKNLTLEKLVEKAISFETVNQQANIMEKNCGEVEEVCSLSKPSGRCWGCGESGHVIHDQRCPASLKKCRKCSFIGHFHKYCNKEYKDTKFPKEEKSKYVNAIDADVIDSDDEYLF